MTTGVGSAGLVPQKRSDLASAVFGVEVTITNGARNSLSLPETAVIWSKSGYLVWVSAGHNSFRPVMVSVGLEADGRVEIRSGLNAGDVVVTEGAYLVNSEYAFKHGRDAMAGMKM